MSGTNSLIGNTSAKSALSKNLLNANVEAIKNDKKGAKKQGKKK